MDKALGKDRDYDTRERPCERRDMKHIYLNLRLFEGEGGAGSAGAETAGATTGEVTDTQEVQEEKGDGQEKNVQEHESGQDKSPDKRMEEYNRFKAEFKDLYGQEVKNAINQRYKENEQLKQQLDSFGPLINMLSAKYGLEDADVSTIMEAINKDNSFWEESAMKEGMSVDQYKKMKQYEAEHRQLIESAKRAEQIRQREQTWARWNQEADMCMQKFPQFNMDTELNNPDFVRLLGAGLDVESAYKAAHFDELTHGIAAKTEEKTRKKVADTIRSGAGRPIENGIAAGGANKAKTSAWDLSDEEFAGLMEKVKRGERIESFDM